MYKLERCPICGGESNIAPVVSAISTNNKCCYRYHITCRDCGLTTKSVTVNFGYSVDMGAWAITDELEKLISTWNNREGLKCITEK